MTRKTLLSLTAVAIVACVCGVTPDRAEARAQYNKAFKDMYEEHFEGKDVSLRCDVCHGEKGKNKKVRSKYGEDLWEKLGDKNVKDKDAIVKALEETAKMDSHIEGKTYGEMLKAGILPPAAE